MGGSNILAYALTMDPAAFEAGVARAKRAQQELKEGAEEVESAHKNMHAALHLAADTLGDSLGEIGQLAHFLFNPYMLAIAGVVTAVHLLEDEAEQAQDRLKELISDSLTARENMERALQEGEMQAAEANEDFLRSLEHSADGFDEKTDAMRAAIEQGETYAEGLKRQTEAELELRKAQIEGARLRGELTPTQALHATHQAEAEARRRNFQTEDDAAQGKIALERGRIPSADTLATETAMALDAEHATIPKRQALELLNKNLATEEEKLKAAKEAKAAADANMRNPSLGTAVTAFATSFLGFHNKAMEIGANASFTAEGADQVYKTEAAAVAGYSERKSTAESALKNDEANVAALQKKVQLDKEARENLTREIDQEQRLLQIKRRAFEIQEEELEAADRQKEQNALMANTNWHTMFAPTNFEKMGFHFGGGGPTLMQDHARQIATHTARMLDVLLSIDAKIIPISGMPGVNASFTF